MPIASKLVYFQRRHSPAQPDPPPPEPPDPRRRPHRAAPGGRRAYRKPGQELVPGNRRGSGECGVSAPSTIEPARSLLFNARLRSNESDDQLPDTVQQARERLLQRLRSLELSGRRQTPSASETIWDGINLPADFGTSTSGDGISSSLTNCFAPSASFATYKVQETAAEPFSIADKCTPITPCSEPVAKPPEEPCREAKESEDTESSVDCSICLEKCGDPDGLIQLHCKHIFHSACLEQWLQSRRDCPYCRASVLLTD